MTVGGQNYKHLTVTLEYQHGDEVDPCPTLLFANSMVPHGWIQQYYPCRRNTLQPHMRIPRNLIGIS